MATREELAATSRKRHPEVVAYLERLPPPARALASDLRKLAHATVKDARERIYYGVPFFFVDGVGFCYVSPAKKHLTLGIVWGASIRDDTGLLVGTGKSPIRKVALAYDDPIPDAARDWIQRSAEKAREALDRS